MHNLALITPWPPQHSGIADYAHDLAQGLAEQGVQVNVYSDAVDSRESSHTSSIANLKIYSLSDYPGPASFDRVVYQMGNNARYHASMIGPLGRHGGVVHLHDLVLHHMVYDLTSMAGQGRLYYQLIQHWYGRDAVRRVQQWNRNSEQHFVHSEGVTDIPLFDPLLRFADACIVHSEYTRQRITQHFPDLPCEVIPQTYRHVQHADRTPGKTLRVGVFGMVTPRTHTELLIESAAQAIGQGADLHVHVAGDVMHNGKGLQSLVAQLGVETNVTFHGRVDDATFQKLLRSTDLCVALRYPTMGETSGVVSRALQMGIPTVVNDIGWFAELPACVTKLPCHQPDLQQQLASWLVRHATDESYHHGVRREAQRYAHEVFDFERVNLRYLSLLAGFPAGNRRQSAA